MTKTKLKEKARRNGLPLEALCVKCGDIMMPTYENNGFSSPDPTKVELTGFRCACGGAYVY
jgi:hypothetical protein